ncbi:sulfate ABC transporter permease subunit CysT [Zhongshania sp.]|uniref:sulfate ABC transporter permease subunit CysT n=1 Tax=Zhongshania sp. TaxID=1971902 RepID=UPI00356296E5
MKLYSHSPLPGFAPAFFYTVVYLSLIVVIPLSGLFFKTTELGIAQFWDLISGERVSHALGLSFATAFAAALINAVFGLLIAWVFVRYDFTGKRVFDAIIDLPFALPTAVAGIALSTLYASNGWLGSLFNSVGIDVAYTPLGIVIALTFIGLPFVVRSVEPVLRELEQELEEAAASLGANRWQTLYRVVFPTLLPALLSGFALAFARGVGEYGSVIFIAGNVPYVSEVAPLLIVIKLEEYDYAGATAVAAAMLLISFVLLILINALQAWSQRYKASSGKVNTALDEEFVA